MKYRYFLPLLFSLSATAQDSVQTAASRSHRPHRWIRPAAGAAYAGAIWLSYRHFDAPIKSYAQRHQSSGPTAVSRSVSWMGTGKGQAIAWTATTAWAFASRNERLKQVSLVWAGAAMLNSMLTDHTKSSFQRYRPSSGMPNDMFDWSKGPQRNRSFVSGHTSAAFSAATVFATVYRDKRWVPPVAYGLASLVGLSRIYDNAHWASDVLAGAAVGYLSAKGSMALYRFAGRRLHFLPGNSRPRLLYRP